MRYSESREETVRNFLYDKELATLPELKAALRTSAPMTVFRTLRRVNYLSSYSHRGRFYTLREVPDFDLLRQRRWLDKPKPGTRLPNLTGLCT
jgi:hypothetical protein